MDAERFVRTTAKLATMALALGLPATAPAATASAVRHSPSSSALLYVSAGAEVDVYPLAKVLANANPAPLRRITGFGNADSVAVDRSGNLYVADQFINQIYEFKPGRNQPFKRIRLGVHGPVQVAVGHDGSVYVANVPSSGQPGAVVEYAGGSDKPTRKISDFGGASPTAICLDAQNNLYVGYASSYGVGVVKVYGPHAIRGKDLGLQFAPAPLGIVVDQSGDIAISGFTVKQHGSFGILLYYTISYLPGHTDPQIPVGSEPVGQMAITPDESAIVVGGAAVTSYTYFGFQILGVMPRQASGIAISPPDPG